MSTDNINQDNRVRDIEYMQHLEEEIERLQIQNQIWQQFYNSHKISAEVHPFANLTDAEREAVINIINDPKVDYNLFDWNECQSIVNMVRIFS